MKRSTQSQMILSHLRGGRGITAIEALNLYHCFRLAARIADLRDLGHRINTNMISIEDGKSIAYYTLK